MSKCIFGSFISIKCLNIRKESTCEFLIFRVFQLARAPKFANHLPQLKVMSEPRGVSHPAQLTGFGSGLEAHDLGVDLYHNLDEIPLLFGELG